MVSFVVTVAVTLFLLLIPVCTTTQGVGTFGVLPNEDGSGVRGYSSSLSVILGDMLCRLCDSIQNERQKRRCKRQNCIFTRSRFGAVNLIF
uniref:Uncharacterized protein n=1 Tax=Magallana gigas TaxID=29159 RepID=K1R5E1_MAGGI